MTKPTPTVTWDINVGTIIHIVVLICTAGAIYGNFSSRLEKFEELNKQSSQQMTELSIQETRIEHYLTSQDRSYWKKVAENGDGGEITEKR